MNCRFLFFLVAMTVLGRLHGQGTNASSRRADETIRLSRADRLTFSIQEDPVKSIPPSEVFVNAAGEISFPVSRAFDDSITLPAVGRTISEVRQELKERLEKEFYRTATIDLRVKTQIGRPTTILLVGAVRQNQVLIAPNETKTIYEGVYAAGPTEWANLKKVKLSRLDPATGKRVTTIVNLEEIRKGDTRRDMELKDGDRIEIPEAGFKF